MSIRNRTNLFMLPALRSQVCGAQCAPNRIGWPESATVAGFHVVLFVLKLDFNSERHAVNGETMHGVIVQA